MPKMPAINDTKPTILYIEDNPANATLIERVLQAFGYNLIIAETGFKGIDAALDHNPDLILIDIDLPDISGFEVSMRLREVEEFYRTPFIAVTAAYGEEYREMARLAGISSYVTKPVNVDLLCQKVEDYLNEEKENFLVDVDLEDETLIPDQRTVRHLIRKVRELEASNAELRTNNRELVEQLVSQLRVVEAANADLRRLDKVKDSLIQRIAHELRTPLTVLVGYSDILSSSGPFQKALRGDPQLSRYIEGLSDSIERIAKVVDEIIMISRLASGKITIVLGPVNPLDIARRAIQKFDEALKKRQIKLELVKPRRWPSRMSADENLLFVVFTNLISNAVKYTPDGGTITVAASQADNRIHFTVSDTGIGIDPYEQLRIFDRFYSATDVELHSTSKTAFRGSGSGLGLAICKLIAEAHGGKIYVESVGQDENTLPGSTFHLEFPVNMMKGL